MGFFEPRNYERIAAELGRIFGADDRVTGMIPDTYGDPSEVRPYGDRIRMPRSSEIVRPLVDMGRGFVQAPRGEWYDLLGADDRVTGMIRTPSEAGGFNWDQDQYRILNADDRVTGMIPDTYGDPSEVRPYGDRIRMPKSSDIVRPIVREGKEAASLMSLDDIARGLTLADDAESFIDRQTYLEDGTVGSEERARGYKGEGTIELMRGIGYGAANVPDAILGLAVDEDNILRMQPQAIKHVLAYEPTGDEDIDSALSAVHSLGEGSGETLATGGIAGLMRKGILTGAQHIPRQMMFRAPEAVKNTLPYSWQNKAHRMPHISDALKSEKGSNLLDTVSDGVTELAMINQLAQEENWGTEDLATLGALTFGTGLLANHISTGLPKPTWKPVDSNRPPYEEAILQREAARKAEMKKHDKKHGSPSKEITQGDKKVRIRYDTLHPAVNKHVPQLMTYKKQVIHDENFHHPLYHLPERYLDPRYADYVNAIEDKKKREWERKKHLLPGSPRPHQIQYKTNIKDKGKSGGENIRAYLSQAEKDARAREQAKEIPTLENEKIKVFADGEKPSVQLSPNDGLILKNELRRVFGKRAQLDKTDDNTFHITLPNGVELNAQTVNEIKPSDPWATRQRHGLPSRTKFSLKGSLDHVDQFDLIKLSNLADADTLQHEAVHFAMNTVTTKKEKEMLRKLFGEREEEQVKGVMDAIRQEQVTRNLHPGPFVNGLLRKIERFGNYVKSFTENVPTAIAKRDLSYLEGRSPRETLRDYAESFIDGSVWGRDLAPVMKDIVQRHHDEIAETLKKQHSILYPERQRITLAQRLPNIFSILPSNNLPLRIDNSVLNKVLLEKHSDSITPEHIAQLPQALEHPVMIIKAGWDTYGKSAKEFKQKNEKNENTYNFLLDVVDKNNANILVPIGLGYEKGNRVKSIYGMTTNGEIPLKRPDIKKIIQMAKHDNLVYVDKDKLLSMVKAYAPKDYYEIRDYLEHHLPAHVYTPESYREYRNRRGMKPEIDFENYYDPVNR